MQQKTPFQVSSFFKEQTNTFRMEVRLDSNQKLKITLYDFVDWRVYQKQYTQKDIGKEIHYIADLQFIYSSLAQNNTDEKENKLKDLGTIKDYNFGDCVKNGQIPCYKIQSQGRITVFMEITQSRSNRKICYQSKLQLTKIKQMNQIEIFTQKAYLQKVQSSHKFIEQLQSLREEKIQLQNKYNKLERQNILLKQQFDKTKQDWITEFKIIKEELKLLKEENNMKDKVPKIFYGQSKQWQAFQQNAVSIKVNFQHLNLQKIPKIFTSLYGPTSHWITTGATSIYSPSNKQFMVYINNISQATLLSNNHSLQYQIIPQE